MNRISKRRQRRRKRRNRFLIVTLVILLLGVLGTIGYGAYLTNKIKDITNEPNEDLNRGEQSEKRVDEFDPKVDNFSVLFIGIDQRNLQQKGLSDALILATFNQQDKSIEMVSIPRDSRVEIVDWRNGATDKITHAHSYGGTDMTVETVENLLDIPVDYYVELNFQAFIEVIDTLDGVTVDVPYTFSEQDSDDNQNAITIEEGVQTLNGEEALAFARTRKHDNDIKRGERQQQIIKAIAKKGVSPSALPKYGQLIDDVGENMKTNVTFDMIRRLATYVGSIQNIKTHTLEGSNSIINNIFYYKLDESSVENVSNTLKNNLNLTDEHREKEEAS